MWTFLLGIVIGLIFMFVFLCVLLLGKMSDLELENIKLKSERDLYKNQINDISKKLGIKIITKEV